MTLRSHRSTLMRRSALALAIGLGGAVAASAGTAHAALFTQVTGDYTPGSELTVYFPCGDPVNYVGTVWFEEQGNEFAITSLPATVDPDAFSIKITIPADIPVGATISLFGKCEDDGNQEAVYYSLGESIVVESAGNLADTPTGSSTVPMLLIATGMVVGGVALLPRRRAA